MYITQCTLDTIHCTLLCTFLLYTVYSTLYVVYSYMYIVHCTQIGSFYVIVTDCFNRCDFCLVKGEVTFTLCAIHLYWWLCFDRKQFQNEAKFDYVYISPRVNSCEDYVRGAWMEMLYSIRVIRTLINRTRHRS